MEDILHAVESYLLPSRQRRLILRMRGKIILKEYQGEPIVSIVNSNSFIHVRKIVCL
ncbi:MAG: hypothetical protein Ct9H300mP28_06210 [Pseudomonadota bacterium]|nr:MAG: hypothetical protein Ct9H300mP28_06210 [Pseudomonadota bacterium]